jgi:hypothetical protein
MEQKKKAVNVFKGRTMTEEEWLKCENPFELLEVCSEIVRLTRRKGRLFAVACCYRIVNLIPDPKNQIAVETAAQFADGFVTKEQLLAAHTAAKTGFHDPTYETGAPEGFEGRLNSAQRAVIAVSMPFTTASIVSSLASFAEGDGRNPGPERKAQSNLLRDIFGNPFRPVTLNHSWLTPTVLALAKGIYDKKAFEHMPILADALQDAGCNNEDILNHCRRPGEHVRGCWCVDLLLGRE